MSLKLSPGCQCCDEPDPPLTDLCICGETVQMVLIFQDEAQSVYSPSGTTAWDADVSDWEDKVAIFGAPEYAQLCQVWTQSGLPVPAEATSVCKPSTRDMPDGWTWDDLVRSPTEAEVKAVYDSAKGGAGVDDPTDLVLLGVDVSGSMNLATLGDGYSDFKDYLDSIGVDYKQVLFSHERWVQLTTDNYTDTVGGETPAEFDVNLTGLVNGTDCDICEDMVGDFTLTDPLMITEDTNPDLSEDGWSLNGCRTFCWSKSADVPYGATSACVWNYKISTSEILQGVSCEWFEDFPTDPPFYTRVTYKFVFYGYTLARFRISDTEYKWRLIVNFDLELSCSDSYGSETVNVTDGWYWEFTDTSPDCNLTGDETWVAYFPEDVPLLTVYCYDTFEADFSTWCDYDLTLNNVETV